MPLMLVNLINSTSVYNVVKSQKLNTIAMIDKKVILFDTLALYSLPGI